MKGYPSEIEEQMQRYYQTLSEKDRRRYAAVEAIKLGYGGKGYICKLFGCDYKTLSRGIEEIQDKNIVDKAGIRRPGAGQKPAIENQGLTEAFFRVLAKHTAGSPMEEKVKWTNLTRKQIAEKLEKEGFQLSVTVVKKLLDKHNFCRRKARKTKSGRQTENRDEQFQKIDWLKEAYNKSHNPVLSMDSKKKNP